MDRDRDGEALAEAAYHQLVASASTEEVAFWLGAVQMARWLLHGFRVPEVEEYFLRLQRETGRRFEEEWTRLLQ